MGTLTPIASERPRRAMERLQQLLLGGGLKAQVRSRRRWDAAQQHALAGGALCGGAALAEACVAPPRQRLPAQRLPRLQCAPQ